MANFETPALGEYQIIPHLREGTMAHSKPFVAKPEHQASVGFPGELVPDWEKNAVIRSWASWCRSRARCRYSWIRA